MPRGPVSGPGMKGLGVLERKSVRFA
jgi:hypothetical protein